MIQKKTARGIELALLLFLAVLLAWGTAMERQQQGIADHLIRLHVVANSDSEKDQAVKLQVRDEVIAAAEPLLSGVENQTQAMAVLRGHLPELEKAANRALRRNRDFHNATVSLKRELFGTRAYEGFSLPGGYYDALRVEIGAGEGHNWWCVVYPQICMAATAEDLDVAAAMGGLDQEQILLLEGETPEYRLEFRSIELLEDLLGWIRGRKSGIPVSR